LNITRDARQCRRPVVFNGAHREIQDLRNFFVSHPYKKTQLDYALVAIPFHEAEELKANPSSETAEYLREAKEELDKLMRHIDGQRQDSGGAS
jgi:hypothetical protein